MGDEPYAVLLPWMVFAVIDRARVDGPFWAAIAALITSLTLIATSSRHSESGTRNTILLGSLAVFATLAVAGALHRADTGFVAHYGRALSAMGFTVIALGSLAFTPATEHFTRPHVRPSRGSDPQFRRLNVLLTLIWAAAFAGIALAHVAAATIGTPEAFTILNWVAPIALGAVAAHRTRVCWDDFNDDELDEPDPIRDLALDWQPPAVNPSDH
jgi:hypothetical protein